MFQEPGQSAFDCRDARPVLNTDLFPEFNENRYNSRDVVRFTSLPSVTNSNWQATTRLASKASVRWVFVQEPADADVLILSDVLILETDLETFLSALRVFIGSDVVMREFEDSLLDRTRNLPDMFVFQHPDRTLPSKIILHGSKANWPPLGITSAVATAMAVGNEEDFKIMRRCRERGLSADPFPYSPTDEDHAVFSGLLGLSDQLL